MFSPQPPRHISTLPECEVSECPLLRGCCGISRRDTDIDRRPTLTHTGSSPVAGTWVRGQQHRLILPYRANRRFGNDSAAKRPGQSC